MASMHLVGRIHHRRPNPTCSRSRLGVSTHSADPGTVDSPSRGAPGQNGGGSESSWLGPRGSRPSPSRKIVTDCKNGFQWSGNADWKVVARTAFPQVYDPAPDLPQHHPTLPAQASRELPNGNEILPRVASSALERR